MRSASQKILWFLLPLMAAGELSGQVCRLSVAGLNRGRKVLGPVSTECPSALHTAPFGNWGVTSNFGPAVNGHQFDGWCDNTEICDNLGFCRRDCTGRWKEWNSCTDHPLYRAPNCFLYNAENCTEQVSTTGVNVLGTQTVDIPVGCPVDSDGDGAFDQGGCGNVSSYSHGTNLMSLYELDPLTGNDLVQTLYFPETPVELTCDVWGCLPNGSRWVAPISYDSPPSPPKVFAEMAVAVSFGAFLDPDQVCGAAPSTLTNVSAASYLELSAAAESIVSAFGPNLAPTTERAADTPLPTSLGGVTVTLTDSARNERLAPILFASPEQLSFVVPASVALGEVKVSVAGVGGGVRATGRLVNERVSPGLFTANADGRGVAAALVVRVDMDGSQVVEPVFACDSLPGSCEATPLDLGSATEEVFLALFGTGIRNRAELSSVQAAIGGVPVEVLYAGAQGFFVGLDQVNLRLPRTLAGSGEVEVRLQVDGKPANAVLIRME